MDECRGSREGYRLPTINSNNRGSGGDDDGDSDGGSSDLPVYKRENNMHEAVVWNGL